jgi:CBS domain-containing protein
MQERQVRRLPVVDERGRIVGIVVRSELLRALVEPTGGAPDESPRPASSNGEIS